MESKLSRERPAVAFASAALLKEPRLLVLVDKAEASSGATRPFSGEFAVVGVLRPVEGPGDMELRRGGSSEKAKKSDGLWPSNSSEGGRRFPRPRTKLRFRLSEENVSRTERPVGADCCCILSPLTDQGTST